MNKSMSFTLYNTLQYHSYKVTYILSICGISVFLSNPIIFQKGYRNTLLEEEKRHVPWSLQPSALPFMLGDTFTPYLVKFLSFFSIR